MAWPYKCSPLIDRTKKKNPGVATDIMYVMNLYIRKYIIYIPNIPYFWEWERNQILIYNIKNITSGFSIFIFLFLVSYKDEINSKLYIKKYLAPYEIDMHFHMFYKLLKNEYFWAYLKIKLTYWKKATLDIRLCCYL